MIDSSDTREDDENYKNAVDMLFEALEKRSPRHYAVRQYKKYKLAAGKTAKSILVSCGARLSPFDIEELRNLMEYDELEFDSLGDERTALFIVTSDTDSTFDFLPAMLIMQIMNTLCTKADTEYGGRLPLHVRFLLDEFANQRIPGMHRLISTIRSREISASLVLQSLSQLKAIYKEATDIITDNCDSMLFLGGKGSTTLKEISEMLGKETIDTVTSSDTRGMSPSHSSNYGLTGKELMSRNELAVMDGGKCILQLGGAPPFLSKKYDITKHPNYKYTAGYDKKNALGVRAYVRRARKSPALLRPGDIAEYFEVTV
jgi:type IV secretion system protein VirD4